MCQYVGEKLCFFLGQVITFLTSKSWETRIAAGQAVEAILKNVKPWKPVFQANAGGSSSRESTPASEDLQFDLLSFDNFNINQVQPFDATHFDLHTNTVPFYTSPSLPPSLPSISHTLGTGVSSRHGSPLFHWRGIFSGQ